MQQNSQATFRSAIIAAGSLSRTLMGAADKATWGELVNGTVLDRPAAELRGRSVLIATSDQFRAAAALIELDGIASRIVLYPPDLSREHLAYVVSTADADVLITDQLDVAADDRVASGVNTVVTCRPGLIPVDADAGPHVESEWILLTSGTTGLPKLAVHTRASLAGASVQADASAQSIVWSTYYDMRRFGGMQIFLYAALRGTSLVLSNAHEPVADFLHRAGASGVTHMTGTPSHWRRALMSPAANSINPVYVRMSGEISDQAILNQVKAQYPKAKIAHTFASTEAGVGFNVDDGLMGFPVEILQSNPLIEMKVQDDTLRIRSSRTATRYLGANPPVLTAADGFVDTGDTLELRDGRYYFTGRRDGIINVGGLKVHPEEVEAVINRHPFVVMSIVKAKRSPITGALVIADVVLKSVPSNNSAQAFESPERDILLFCRAELAPHKVPAAINVVPMLTIGQSGKLVRRHA